MEQKKVNLTFKCRECGKEVNIKVYPKDLERWSNREDLIQNCFPYLRSSEREMFLTCICRDCFNQMFKDDIL